MQRKLAQGPVPTAPPSPLPRFPLLLLQIPSMVRKGYVLLTATMTRFVILPQGDSNPPCSASVQFKHCSFPLAGVFLWLKAAPAVPGQLGTSGHSSCSPQRVWLPEHVFKFCSQLLSLAFFSLSCLCPRNSSLKLPKLSPAWCGIGATGHTGSCALRAPPAQLFFCWVSSFSHH